MDNKNNSRVVQLAAEEAAHAAARGDSVTYSLIVDEVGGNDVAARAQIVRDIDVADSRQTYDQGKAQR